MTVSRRKCLIPLLLLGILVAGVGILVRATMWPESDTSRAVKEKKPNTLEASPQPAQISVPAGAAETATEAAGERECPAGAGLLRKPDEVSDEWFAGLVECMGGEEAALRYLEGLGYGRFPSAPQTEEERRSEARKREEKIQTARQDILIAQLEGAELEEYLRYMEHCRPRVKRDEILTDEFLAELAAERARVKRTQLDNIERLKASPVLLRSEPLPTADPCDPFVLQQVAWRRVAIPLIISKWPPLDAEVQAALMAAFQHRLGSLSPFNAARDTVLGYLMDGVAAHCGAEGSQLLKESFYGCSNEAARLRILNAYAKTLPCIERADFLAYAMRNDASERVRTKAREGFRQMLLEGYRLGKEENRAISEKYAADKRELFEEFLRKLERRRLGKEENRAISENYAAEKHKLFEEFLYKGADDALSTLVYWLDADIEVDRAILQRLIESSPDVEVRDEAIEMLRRYVEGQERSGDDDAE